MTRTRRWWLSALVLGVAISLPLVVQIVLSVTGADARQAGDGRTGPELVADVHALIGRIDRDGADANVRARIRRFVHREPRTTDLLAEALHPAFDERREAEGWERWRVEAALQIIGINDRLTAVLGPWLAGGDPELRERAEAALLGGGGGFSANQRWILIEQLNDPRRPSALQRVYLRRLLQGDPALRRLHRFLLDILDDADPGVHLAGFGALVELAGRYQSGRAAARRVLADRVAPLLPAVAERLNVTAWYPAVSRILVDAGEVGQTLALAHAADHASLGQQVRLARHMADSPWFDAIRQGDDPHWFDDLAAALLVPALERGSAAEKQVAMAIVPRLRLVPEPMVAPMARLLEDADFGVRREALERLVGGRAGGPAFVRGVSDVLGGAVDGAAINGFDQLARRGGPYAPAFITAGISMIRHRESTRRYSAVSFLARCAPQDAARVAAALAAALADDFDDVVFRAADGLRNYGRAAAAQQPALEAALERHPTGTLGDRIRTALKAIR